MALQWLPCQTPGVIGSVLGLVGPVSVYCDWVRWKVGSATFISVWQHVKLSEQIRPWDALACCWDVKQPTNNNSCLKSTNKYRKHSTIRVGRCKVKHCRQLSLSLRGHTVNWPGGSGPWSSSLGVPYVKQTPHWPGGKATASRAEGPGFDFSLRRGVIFGSSHTSDLNILHSSGYPARRLALQGQCGDWLAQYQYTVTGWSRKFDLQLLSQCGSTLTCLSRSAHELH